ncbi:MAG: MucR family transcriptional regulator [Caulobacteraceae bacterium]|nr:MucR family transcriptional regulator [Caulobacteraceae bacterium]
MTDVATEPSDLTGMTAAIVSAFVMKNRLEPHQVASLVLSVHQALTGVGGEAAPEAAADETKSKAEIKRSITADHLISFIDGKEYRTLKRHVGLHGMTMDEYRERFGLPADYPSTAQSYSALRSAMAKAIGLGAGGRSMPKAAAPKAKPAPKARKPKATAGA